MLLLGSIVNLIVAILCAILLNVGGEHEEETAYSNSEGDRSQRCCWRVTRFEMPGALIISSFRTTEEGDPVTAREPDDLVPTWVHFHDSDRLHPNHHVESILANGRGWPMISFWCEMELDRFQPADPHHTIGGITTGLPEFQTGPLLLWFTPVIPYWPVWSGLIVNTLFYALILALVIWGPRNVRSWVRVKRGRCRDCGYDLRCHLGEVCPECGSRKVARGPA